MPGPVVSDFQGCSFKGTDLSRHVTDWKDTRQFALAPHRFWKKDGAEIEVLGRKPHQAKVTLAYAGPSWRKDWLPLASSLDADPSGLLVHPVYGQMPAVCEGFAEAAMNLEFAPNLYVVPLTFIEDQVDAKIDRVEATPHILQDRAQRHGAALLARVLDLGPVHDNVLRYVTAALGYAAAAVATTEQAASYGGLLDAQLQQVESNAVAARAALRVATAPVGSALAYETIALVELLYDDCAQLAAAAAVAVGGDLIDYEVPSTTHIAVLARRFYGADGLVRIPEILANNRGRIPNPAAIATGTTLRIAAPTASR